MSAQGLASKPVRIVVPFPAGGVISLVTRSFTTELGTAPGTNVIVENRAGAGNLIAPLIFAGSLTVACQMLLHPGMSHGPATRSGADQER